MRRSLVTVSLMIVGVLLSSSTVSSAAPHTQKRVSAPSASRQAVGSPGDSAAPAESVAAPAQPAAAGDTTVSKGRYGSRKALLERLRKRLRESPKTPDYDRLIDNDNDGVDDRLQKASPSDSAVRQAAPPPDSSDSSPPKRRE